MQLYTSHAMGGGGYNLGPTFQKGTILSPIFYRRICAFYIPLALRWSFGFGAYFFDIGHKVPLPPILCRVKFIHPSVGKTIVPTWRIACLAELLFERWLPEWMPNSRSRAFLYPWLPEESLCPEYIQRHPTGTTNLVPAKRGIMAPWLRLRDCI